MAVLRFAKYPPSLYGNNVENNPINSTYLANYLSV